MGYPAPVELMERKDKWIRRWKVKSFNNQYVYIVGIDKHGIYGCSCPNFKYSGKALRNCKHINLIRLSFEITEIEGTITKGKKE